MGMGLGDLNSRTYGNAVNTLSTKSPPHYIPLSLFPGKLSETKGRRRLSITFLNTSVLLLSLMTKSHTLDGKTKALGCFHSDSLWMFTQNIHCTFKEPETDYKTGLVIAREHLLKTT